MYFVDWEDAGHIEHTGYVLYKYLDTITDQFMAIVDGMWTEVQSLDKIVIRVTSVGDRTELILRTGTFTKCYRTVDEILTLHSCCCPEDCGIAEYSPCSAGDRENPAWNEAIANSSPHHQDLPS